MFVEQNKRKIIISATDTIAALAKLDNCVQEVGAAIEESKCFPVEAASAAQRLLELKEELMQAAVEEEAIQKNIQVFDNNDEMLLQMLAYKFNDLGYNLVVSRDADNMTLYRFEIASDRYITIRVEYGQLALVQMCPENPNFKRISEFLCETQDLNGLLTSFASFN